MTATLFVLYTVLSGAQQGVLAFLLREFVPYRFSAWVNAAFHYGGGLLYALIVGYAAYVTPAPLWYTLALAGLLRLALFDPAVNLAHGYTAQRNGQWWEPLFSVGFSSLTDRIIRWVANLLGANPSALSGGLRVASLAAVMRLLYAHYS